MKSDFVHTVLLDRRPAPDRAQRRLSLVTLIAAHGYWILALGCLLEGETVLVLAALAAQRGYLNPAAVVTIAAASAFASNQFFFWLGRRHGAALLDRWPALASRSAKIRRLIERHASLAAVAVRFVYGTRLVGPMLIGASSMPQLRFAVLNALSAIAWALLVGAAGWLFGEAAQAIFGHLAHVEGWLFCALIAALVAWRLLRHHSAKADQSPYLGDVSSRALNASFSETTEGSDGAHLAQQGLPRIRQSHP